MPMILGHRGYSAEYLENSMQAFRAALEAGMDGFELDVQPTRDGVCVVMHDEELGRTAQAPGILREMKAGQLPLLLNGEPIPRLAEVLALPARLTNVELKGRSVWQLALEIVQAESALHRVLFSSFEHAAIFQLHTACPWARCGLLWTNDEASQVTENQIDKLPVDFTLHLPIGAIQARPEFWMTYGERIVLWDLMSARQAQAVTFTPAVIVADSPV